jgi:hypothetical protein
MDWLRAKDDLTAWTGLERDALHVYGGLVGMLALALLLRRTVADLLPWLGVLGVELANEAYDMMADGLAEQWEWDGARHDLWNTMIAPTLLLLAARYLPRLFVRVDEAPGITGSE